MLSFDVVEWGAPLQKIERETPQPRGTEVLVKIKYCGVCHSDAHIRDGYFDLGGGKRLQMSERGMRLPATLGHEALGTVIAAGPDTTNVVIGADRLVYPWTGCGGCARCREGLDNYCMAPSMLGIQRPGGYADHLIVPHPRYLIDAGDLDPAWAATLACSGLSTYSAVAKLQPIPRPEWVMVIGAGGLGLSAIGMLRALGHENIVAVDIEERKLTAALAAGAAASLDGRAADARKKVASHHRGRALWGGRFRRRRGDRAIGARRAAQRRQTHPGRPIRRGAGLSIGATILRALTVRGSHLGSVGELREVVALARAGEIRPLPIETRELAAVSRTLDELKDGGIVGRVVARI